MSPTAIQQQLEHVAQILIDVDGCLIAGAIALPGAAVFIDRYRDKLTLVTNNSTDTAIGLSHRLSGLGLEVDPNSICLAGEEAIRVAREQFDGARVMMLANDMMQDAAQAAGLHLVTSTPEVLVVCRDTTLTWEKLSNAVLAIDAGCPVILANEDITHPGETGPAIETGAIYALLNACAQPSRLISIGKPHPAFYKRVLGSISPENAVMIGDNPLTDIAGADRLGIPSILIGQHPAAVAPGVERLLKS